MKCGSCKHWHNETYGLDYEESLGSCHALPDIPFAWHYAQREVIWTSPNDPPNGLKCSFHKGLDT